jgi:hypothetical protein
MRLLSREGTAVGSELLAIDRRRARDYARVLAAAGHPPAGWNPTGEHGAPTGWDLVLVAPRTISVLLYELTGQALAQLERGAAASSAPTPCLTTTSSWPAPTSQELPDAAGYTFTVLALLRWARRWIS